LSNSPDIHPEFERMLGRAAKESLLGQRGHVVWLFGLSGSGKSTLAHAVERALHEQGRATALLDGDNLRTGLNAGLGFSDEDRAENIRRAAETAKLFASNGVIVLASFICPKESLRQAAKAIIGAADLTTIYVRASFATCQQRDVKGLYAKAAGGGVAHFTGKDSGFEEPSEVALVVDTESSTIADGCAAILAAITHKISL
jgi:adenylylsulfate kinase